LLPTKERLAFSNWILGLSDPIDEQSKIRAYELYENSILENTEIGTIKGLQQIHAFCSMDYLILLEKQELRIYPKVDLLLLIVCILILFLRI